MARSELDLDGVLAALARDLAEAAPRPDPGLVARVLADAALSGLARDAAEAAPRPGDALVGRILGDAAAVAAGRPDPAPRARSRTVAARPGPAGMLFGWRAGAVAAMTLALALGLGLGLALDGKRLPILDDGRGPAAAFSLASVETDLLGVGGL